MLGVQFFRKASYMYICMYIYIYIYVQVECSDSKENHARGCVFSCLGALIL